MQHGQVPGARRDRVGRDDAWIVVCKTVVTAVMRCEVERAPRLGRKVPLFGSPLDVRRLTRSGLDFGPATNDFLFLFWEQPASFSFSADKSPMQPQKAACLALVLRVTDLEEDLRWCECPARILSLSCAGSAAGDMALLDRAGSRGLMALRTQRAGSCVQLGGLSEGVSLDCV